MYSALRAIFQLANDILCESGTELPFVNGQLTHNGCTQLIMIYSILGCSLDKTLTDNRTLLITSLIRSNSDLVQTYICYVRLSRL